MSDDKPEQPDLQGADPQAPAVEDDAPTGEHPIALDDTTTTQTSQNPAAPDAEASDAEASDAPAVSQNAGPDGDEEGSDRPDDRLVPDAPTGVDAPDDVDTASEDMDATQPVQVAPGPGAPENEQTRFRAPTVDRSLFRPREEDEGEEATEVMAVNPFASEEESDDERAAREQREAEAIEEERRRRSEAEAARQRALGVVAPPQEEDAPLPARPPRRTTDKWFGSLGLFLLRLVVGGMFAIRGYQMLTDIAGTRELLGKLDMPYLQYLPWALGIAHLLAALGLVFGLGVRIIGVCVAALAICVLALVKWGVVPIFQPEMAGFIGELELLLAAVGLMFFTVGGGGWGIDASIRRSREREKYGK